MDVLILLMMFMDVLILADFADDVHGCPDFEVGISPSFLVLVAGIK